MVYAEAVGYPHVNKMISLLHFTGSMAKILSIDLFITGSR